MFERHEIAACPCGAVLPDMGLMRSRGSWKVICTKCGRRGASHRYKTGAREFWNLAVQGHTRFAYGALKDERKD